MNPVAHDSQVESKVNSAGTVANAEFHSPNNSSGSLRRRRKSTSGLTRLERWLLRRILERLGRPPVEIRLWNGETISASAAPQPLGLRIRNRRTLWKLLSDHRFQFGESYVDRSLEIHGDLVDFLIAIGRSLNASGNLAFGVKGLAKWLHKPHRTTVAQSRENVHHHYDLGNDFYKLWLDEQLLYTCAYFSEPSMTLEQAQVAKMNHVCRKVWLQPGETVIEAGCGWGALALHMAREFGVHVRAFNTSHEQILYAQDRARREGLDKRVEFVEDDWRNITGCCDAFVSVGMLEHVGLENYSALGDAVSNCLKPSGRGLIHSIGRNRPLPTDPWIERRIFPGAYPPALSEMMEIFEPRRFSVLDVENLRLHYAQTLEHWLQRFEQASTEVAAMFDERFVRMWRLYLAGSLAAFESGGLQLFQVTFASGTSNIVPRTRRHVYDGGRADPSLFPRAARGTFA